MSSSQPTKPLRKTGLQSRTTSSATDSAAPRTDSRLCFPSPSLWLIIFRQAEHEPASCQTLIACGLPRLGVNTKGTNMAKRSGIVLGWILAAVLGCSGGSSGGLGGASGKGGAGQTGGTTAASGKGGAVQTGGATGGGGAATLGGCAIFPADNPWNQD